jgi:hypothetical protein
MNGDNPAQDRPREPLLDDLGKAIVEGREQAAFLWQAPEDGDARARILELLGVIRTQSAGQGRREMPRLCDELTNWAKASPSPQQVDILQDGFERLYKLWSAAKSGLL